MNDSRQDILSRVRSATETQKTSATDIRAEAKALLPAPGVIQPKFDDLSNRKKFIERATSERLTATVDEVDDWQGAVAAVRNYLARSNIPLNVAMPPSKILTALDWADVSFHHDIAPNEVAAVSVADYAISETGTLVFTSRPDSPTLFNYLALYHIVMVEGGNLLRYMEDYWRIVRDGGNVHPRNINFITGTSGTADIEAQNTRGAHGPRFLHIVIVGGELCTSADHTNSAAI